MHLPITLAIAATLAASSASPIKPRNVKVPITQSTDGVTFKSLLQSGRNRIKQINHHGTSSTQVSSGAVTNVDVSYLAPVVIGGTTYKLIVDTGSSNTWCGARAACEPSSTGVSSNHTVHVGYGTGSFTGTEYYDSASFGGLTVTNQSVGSASQSSGFAPNIDGILGLGPVDLTQNTVSFETTVPTFMDNLFVEGSVSTEVLGVAFHKEKGRRVRTKNGELTLGGTDSSKYNGSITYFPKLNNTKNASRFWGLPFAPFTYGDIVLGSTAGASGIVDTGTSLIYIPTPAYNAFLSAAGGQTDSETGYASFTTEPTENFAFNVGETSLPLTPGQYLVPQAQYRDFGFPKGKYYSWITDGGNSGMNTVMGQKFLENWYSVYDTTNSQIGFAPNAS